MEEEASDLEQRVFDHFKESTRPWPLQNKVGRRFVDWSREQ